MKKNKIAIHQPNFFPWLGYFDKIFKSDKFIFLDHVQFPKKGGTWSNRVKLLLAGEGRWITANVNRKYSGTLPISKINFLYDIPWRDKMVKSLESNYNKHLYFKEIMDTIKPLILNNESNVAKYNINAILKISELLGMNKKKFLLSSELHSTGDSNEMLCDLTKKADCDIYICGGGADEYQDDDYFLNNGVLVEYQNFKENYYFQNNIKEFISGLSVIDAAMNLGWKGLEKLLKKNN